MKLMFRDQSSTEGSVALDLSRPALEALGGGDEPGLDRVGKRMEAAVRCYLSDKGNGRPAWPYPAFLRGSEVQEDVRLQMHIDGDLWGSFESEAEAQGVSVQQLSEHAAFYLAAEIDAGRITQRILDDLESTQADD
jgi:hypothetical protein